MVALGSASSFNNVRRSECKFVAKNRFAGKRFSPREHLSTVFRSVATTQTKGL